MFTPPLLGGVLKPPPMGEVGDSVESFVRSIREHKLQANAEYLSAAREELKISPLWPRETKTKLSKLAPNSAEARELVKEALANISKSTDRASPYPSGAELQAIYGSPK